MFHVFDYIFLEIYMEFHFNKWNVITTPLKHAWIRKFTKFFPWELRLKWGEILSGHFKNYLLCSGSRPLRAVAYMVINFRSLQQMGSF
jgi:hypothetical protein